MSFVAIIKNSTRDSAVSTSVDGPCSERWHERCVQRAASQQSHDHYTPLTSSPSDASTYTVQQRLQQYLIQSKISRSFQQQITSGLKPCHNNPDNPLPDLLPRTPRDMLLS